MTTNEITMAEAAKAGSNEAFEALYTTYHKKVFALARATVRNETDAEDILQQTFINAWRNIQHLNDPAAFNTWIQRITLNLCNSLLRKKNITILQDAEEDTDILDDVESDELLPAVYAERDDLKDRLGKIIDALSEVQKQTILLYYYDELKVEEIAGVMQCSIGTVKTRLHLARKSIRTEVEEHERKSGQKFYGITGIAMLGLEQILVQQLEAQALSPAVSFTIFQNISQAARPLSYVAEAISEATASATAAGSAGSVGSAVGTGATGVGTAAGVSLAVKITIGAVATAIAVGGGFAVYQSVKDPAPESQHISDDTPYETEIYITEATPEPTPEPAPVSTPAPTPIPTHDEDEAIEDLYSDAYGAYYNILFEKADMYGIGDIEIIDIYGPSDGANFLKGVFYAELIDINADNFPEMLVIWNDGTDMYQDRLSIYGYPENVGLITEMFLRKDGGIGDDIEISDSASGFRYIVNTAYHGGTNEIFSTYYTLVDDSWTLVMSRSEVPDFNTDILGEKLYWSVNDVTVDEQTYNSAPETELGITTSRAISYLESTENFTIDTPLAHTVYNVLYALWLKLEQPLPFDSSSTPPATYYPRIYELPYITSFYDLTLVATPNNKNQKIIFELYIHELPRFEIYATQVKFDAYAAECRIWLSQHGLDEDQYEIIPGNEFIYG